jgi:hypothetical protein
MAIPVGLSGCGRGSVETIPVKGKVTLHGGVWPKAGQINFTPFKPADGFPAQVGSGRFETDGSFVAKTGEHEGLVPGEYRIAVSCWKIEPGEGKSGVSYVQEKFTYPNQSGLTLKIEPGQSGPVIWDYDFPAGTK